MDGWRMDGWMMLCCYEKIPDNLKERVLVGVRGWSMLTNPGACGEVRG